MCGPRGGGGLGACREFLHLHAAGGDERLARNGYREAGLRRLQGRRRNWHRWTEALRRRWGVMARRRCSATGGSSGWESPWASCPIEEGLVACGNAPRVSAPRRCEQWGRAWVLERLHLSVSARRCEQRPVVQKEELPRCAATRSLGTGEVGGKVRKAWSDGADGESHDSCGAKSGGRGSTAIPRGISAYVAPNAAKGGVMICLSDVAALRGLHNCRLADLNRCGYTVDLLLRRRILAGLGMEPSTRTLQEGIKEAWQFGNGGRASSHPRSPSHKVAVHEMKNLFRALRCIRIGHSQKMPWYCVLPNVSKVLRLPLARKLRQDIGC